MKPVGGFNGPTQVKKKQNVSQNEDVPQDMGETKHLREITPPKGRNLMNFQLTKFCLCWNHGIHQHQVPRFKKNHRIVAS